MWQVTFKVEASFSGGDLLSEPPPQVQPVRPPALTLPPPGADPVLMAELRAKGNEVVSLRLRLDELEGRLAAARTELAAPHRVSAPTSLSLPNSRPSSRSKEEMLIRAHQVASVQSQAERDKGAAHMALLDARSQAQLGRAMPAGALPSPPGARQRRALPGNAQGSPSHHHQAPPADYAAAPDPRAHAAGLDAAWQAAGWPEGSAAAYYTYLQANGAQIPYPNEAGAGPAGPAAPAAQRGAGATLRTGGYRKR